MTPRNPNTARRTGGRATAAPIDAEAPILDEGFYRALVEGMNEGVLVRDAGGVIRYASPQFREMLGYAAEELVGSRAEFLLHPDERGRWTEALAAATAGVPQRFEHRLIRKDGSLVWVDVSRRPVLGPDGEFRGSVALVSDVTEARRATRQLEELAEGTAPLTGDELFRAAVQHLAEALDLKAVFAAECVDYPATRVRVLAEWDRGRFAEPREFALAGTACEDTIGGGRVNCLPDNLLERFPQYAARERVSYLGVPLLDPAGERVIGHIALWGGRPIREAEILDNPIFRVFASRIGAELRRKRADDTVRLIASALSTVSGEQFFRTLIEHIVRTFGFTQAFVAECVDEPATRIRTLAFWDAGGFRDNAEMDLAGLPCFVTIREARTYFVPDRLDELYPAERGNSSYLGVPILDSSGKHVIGHFAFVDDKPRRTNVLDNPAFRIFASRAGVELLRKRAEDDLRASEAKYRLLVENQTDLLVKLDRAGRCLFVSPSFCECFGVRERELLGQPFALEVNPLDRDAFGEARGAALAPPYRSHVEVRALTASGWRWLAWAYSGVVDDTGQPVEIIASGRDVTDRRRAEEQARRHLDQLAHVTRLSSMGEMASAIAHEVNQPLTAVVNYSRACVRLLGSGSASADEILALMEQAAAQAERASEIVRHLRSFVRKDDAQLGPVEINYLVTEVVRLVQPEARQSAVEIATELADGLPPVLADNIQIQQVLLNLVRNGVEAIAAADPDRREVRVGTQRGPDGMVEAWVEDTGPGLGAAHAEKVFEPFFTTKAQGMGIGLAISRSIVEAHGGRIWATSAPERGARFCLALPAAA
jgi:PAS domain S-box-containing protein